MPQARRPAAGAPPSCPARRAGPVRVQRRVGRRPQADRVLRLVVLLGPRDRRGHHRGRGRHHLDAQAGRPGRGRAEGLRRVGRQSGRPVPQGAPHARPPRMQHARAPPGRRPGTRAPREPVRGGLPRARPARACPVPVLPPAPACAAMNCQLARRAHQPSGARGRASPPPPGVAICACACLREAAAQAPPHQLLPAAQPAARRAERACRLCMCPRRIDPRQGARAEAAAAARGRWRRRRRRTCAWTSASSTRC